MNLFSAQAGLAHERSILEKVISGRSDYEYFIWHCEKSLVVPKSIANKQQFSSASRLLLKDNWPVVLRPSGGDVVPQSPGLINVSMIYRINRNQYNIAKGYNSICGPIISALADMGLDAYCGSVSESFCDGKYNVVVGGKKIAGTAQFCRPVKSQAGDDEYLAVLAQAVVLGNEKLEPLWNIANRFYQYMNIPTRINHDVHVSLAQNSSYLSEEVNIHFTDALTNHLAHAFSKPENKFKRQSHSIT